MSVELRPLGVNCNLGCQYCYQDPQRDAGNLSRRYDMEKMKAAVEMEGGPFTLFGGEPLMVPLEDLEELWSWGFAKYGRNGVQTNGTLVTQDHIDLFRRYSVAVGISIDGPGSLNDVRWQGSLDRTRNATRRTEQAIQDLCRQGIYPSLIVTLHSVNASADKLPILNEWMKELAQLGVRNVRLHLLESESEVVRRSYSLSAEENIAALRNFFSLERTGCSPRFDLFADMRRMLLGNDRAATCIWTGCDPYTTRAVRGVEGEGQRSNCGRTNKDGIDFIKSTQPGFERYIALYYTPQAAQGCSGCRFFVMCKGQCPGTAENGDWRNRSEHCEIWMTMYREIEQELLSEGNRPISQSVRRPELERRFLNKWARGEMPYLYDMLEAEANAKSLEGTWQSPLAALEAEIEDLLKRGW